jgi:Zn-dependent peptidase ImmA (M78 family)/DNA-binding XRE family transcriptional regulator
MNVLSHGPTSAERPTPYLSSQLARSPWYRVCDNHTMSQGINNQADLGRRIAEAREGSGMTQAKLAGLLGLDRTAIVRAETGERKVSATELAAIAAALARPIDWFFVESPPAVVSRRRDPSVGGFSLSLDLALERIARDIRFLSDRHILTHSDRPAFEMPASFDDAEKLARDARAETEQPDGPMLDLQSGCERLGLLAFSLALGPDAGDAAYVEVADLGSAVVNGTTDPGRRRFSLAHELGHHLVGDAYESEPRLGATDTERMINVFAAHLLMPRPAVQATWNEFSSNSRRLVATAVAVRFRVSWTAACNQLRDLGLISGREREQLVADDLRKGEIFEFGERWQPELEPPSVPPEYARAVIGAYRTGRLAAARAVEMLHGTVAEPELPEIEKASIDELRREFNTRS